MNPLNDDASLEIAGITRAYGEYAIEVTSTAVGESIKGPDVMVVFALLCAGDSRAGEA